MNNTSHGLPRTYSRGFISLGIIIAIVIGVAVLGGGAWYVAKNSTKTSQVSAAIDQDSLVSSSANPTITGTASIPYIRVWVAEGKVTVPESISSADKFNYRWSQASRGTKEPLEYATFQVIDGRWSVQYFGPGQQLEEGIYTVIVMDNRNANIATGGDSQADVIGNVLASGTLTITNQNAANSKKEPEANTTIDWPTIQSFTGPSSLTVGETGTWKVQATDPKNQSVTFVVTWGDEPEVKPADRDVTHPLNRAALGYGQTFSSSVVTHTYAQAGTYTVRLLAFDADASRSSGEKTLTVTVYSASDTGFKVTRPNGGESVKAGQKISIGWSTDGKTLGGNGNNVVTLSLIAKPAEYKGDLRGDIANVEADKLSYTWTPSMSLSGDSYKIVATLTDGTCLPIGPLPYMGATCMAVPQKLATDESDYWFTITP